MLDSLISISNSRASEVLLGCGSKEGSNAGPNGTQNDDMNETVTL